MTTILYIIGAILLITGMIIGLFSRKNRERNVILGSTIFVFGAVLIIIYMTETAGSLF